MISPFFMGRPVDGKYIKGPVRSGVKSVTLVTRFPGVSSVPAVSGVWGFKCFRGSQVFKGSLVFTGCTTQYVLLDMLEMVSLVMVSYLFLHQLACEEQASQSQP